MGSVAAAPHKGEGIDNSEAEEDGPDEEAKDDSSHGNTPTTGDDGEGDAAGEPEDGGDNEQDESHERVEEADGEARDDGQVYEDKNGPDDGEEEEAVLGGCIVPVPAVPSIDKSCYQTELDDEEHSQNGVSNEENVEASHSDGVYCSR